VQQFNALVLAADKAITVVAEPTVSRNARASASANNVDRVAASPSRAWNAPGVEGVVEL
jgi:hypothetical protein